MIKNLLFALGMIVFACGVSSCKKKAVDVNPMYAGSWYGEEASTRHYIEIDLDSKAKYEKVTSSTLTVNGKARVKGSTLKILTKKFEINTEPTYDEDSGLYFMVLDNITFVK